MLSSQNSSYFLFFTTVKRNSCEIFN